MNDSEARRDFDKLDYKRLRLLFNVSNRFRKKCLFIKAFLFFLYHIDMFATPRDFYLKLQLTIATVELYF